MQIDVQNEVGQLREVLIHRPGDEIVRMTQHDLDRMLFDDILAGTEAASEHAMLAEILRAGGATVYEFTDLLQDAVRCAPRDELHALVDHCCELAGVHAVSSYLYEWDADRIAHALVAGVKWSELPNACTGLARIRAQLGGGDPMALRPLPNIMFLRDPCISVYDRVVVGQMATSARAREPLLVSFALRHAPVTSAALSQFHGHGLDESSFQSIEGGDVIVVSPRFLLIGCSERTQAQTIERLSREVLFPQHPQLESVYAVLMPEARSVMHLDTILTQIDITMFLGHEPYVIGNAHQKALPVVRLQRDRPAELIDGASVIDVLREELGPSVSFVSCGGHEPLHQEREQWTDGANAVALSAGHIILYARNTETIRTLADHGFVEVRLSTVQPSDHRVAAVRDAIAQGRAVLSFTGSELSRARGGGRCLTMPLRRNAFDDES